MKRNAEQLGMLTEGESLFDYNEARANHYAIACLRFAAAVTALMWLLNTMGFFIVDKAMMNVVMPAGMVLFLLPTAGERLGWQLGGRAKYWIMSCFMLGISMMCAVLTIQLIAAWACPVILSCHYYSPRFTRFVMVGALLCMLVSFYVGIFVGVWDGNIMRSNAELVGVAVRMEFIRQAAAAGDNIPLRAFNFYYMPRAVIIIVVYLICITLSRRTHGLLIRQDEITKETQRISAELNVASQIQSSMLPNIFPALPERTEFDIYAAMTPAKEVGGDFYDFFMVDEHHLAVVMADVSGKGVPAALFMVIGKTLIKDHTKPDTGLGDVFTEVNELLCQSNSEGLFITAFEGVLDLRSGQFRFVNAGHNPPLIRRGQGEFEYLKAKHGFVLAGMEGLHYQEQSLQLEPGDSLFLYTDGVTEATDRDNGLYGEERLRQTLNQNRTLEVKELCQAVKRDIDQFVGSAPQFDDITMLTLYYSKQERAAG